MTDVGSQIASAMAQIQIDEEIAIQEQRLREAKEIVAEIPSGTRDVDLTLEQSHALNQYEDAMKQLRELRSWEI